MWSGAFKAAGTVALVAAVTLALPGGGSAKPSASQKLFRESLLADDKTTAGVKRLLRTNAGIVDPRSGFVDVTGDGRSDALVLVTTNGAAGTVALYVFSTHGQRTDGEREAKLRVIFRTQSLHRAALRLSGTTVTVVEPLWAAGDDLCCPTRLRERDYAFAADDVTFRRSATRTVVPSR